jgi:hypothetical protein
MTKTFARAVCGSRFDGRISQRIGARVVATKMGERK